jgi:glycosidase
MRYFFLAIGFSALLVSCKLMKKEEEKKNITNNKNQKSMMNRFKPVEWAHSTNVYEVNVRQYTAEGTFNAFAKELPRLKDMGVQTLWFMPVTPIAQKEMKGTMGSYYACSDYTSINPEFGTLDDFKRLVKQAHDMGFKVIIDWVANHTGWDHIWTKTHPKYFEIRYCYQ